MTYLVGDRYKDLLKPVKNPFKKGASDIPLLFKEVSGRDSTDKEAMSLANRAFVDWVRVHRKVRTRPGQCPWYSPSSTMTAIRSLFSFLNGQCGWVVCYDDFKNFDGCLENVLKKLFEERQEEWVSTAWHAAFCAFEFSPFFLN